MNILTFKNHQNNFDKMQYFDVRKYEYVSFLLLDYYYYHLCEIFTRRAIPDTGRVNQIPFGGELGILGVRFLQDMKAKILDTVS